MEYKVGYARVSTYDQNLDLQLNSLKNEGCQEIYTDKISGRHASRPKLDEMIKHLRQGDEVIVWKLDRLARSMVTLTGTLQEIANKGSCVRSITEPQLSTTGPQGKLILNLMATLAEYELDLIRERSRAGVAIARANGKKLGRPPRISKPRQKKVIAAISKGVYTRAEAARMFDVSAGTITRMMQKNAQ